MPYLVISAQHDAENMNIEAYFLGQLSGAQNNSV